MMMMMMIVNMSSARNIRGKAIYMAHTGAVFLLNYKQRRRERGSGGEKEELRERERMMEMVQSLI